MEIVKVVPSGFCKGVIGAIQRVKQALQLYPDQPITICGMLVHNQYVVDAFAKKGVITLNVADRMAALDQIERGVVIFTAHGVDPAVIEKARAKGLIVVDATCSDVKANQKMVLNHLEDGFQIIYIGKKAHPECEAVLALSPAIHPIYSLEDIASLKLPNGPILITNQTTLSSLDIGIYIEALLKRFPQAKVAREICQATLHRQKAVLALEGFDALVVVGDPNSNNTAQLAGIGKAAGIQRILRVESARDLEKENLENLNRVAVTAGASTPHSLSEQVIHYLKTRDEKDFQVDLDQILE